ncbi:MAG: hypothetical protein GX099_06630 [Clostridiaceae bacterium]|jgi:hypothetical protein|nr:hypothetical protein [Clostridiaceae bacterium]NLW89180.1 hypothetical protein [Clostridiaceae bacterium]
MDPILVTIIVTVIVFGGALTAGYFVRAGIRNVKRKIQSSLLGQIYNGINRDLSEKNMSITDVDFIPKAGAKSVSDMSSALVPLISRDFPELNIEQLKSSCEQLLIMTLREISERTGGMETSDKPLLHYGSGNNAIPIRVTDAFREKIRQRIDDLKREGKAETFSHIKIHRTGIRSYDKTAGTRVITFEFAIEYFHVIKQNGEVVPGEPDQLEQTRYNMSVVDIIDESKLTSTEVNAIGVVCPNCGAPVRTLESRQCLYCGVGLTPVDIRVWRADKLTEK